jgi:arylsulfatase A-like enzyme
MSSKRPHEDSLSSRSQASGGLKRRDLLLSGGSLVAASALSSAGLTASAEAQQSASAQAGQRPNIVVIMGDDIGIWNIGAYHRGMMAGRTPNLDKLAAEGMLFTDYYAEASCTAGRANFITGELPIRTGMTTVGQAGAPTGLPAEAVTIATALKGMGYATGQFGKNHLGDKNEFLPTVHGFDEFFGYLYHLDAMEDPAHPAYPQDLLNRVGPRNMVHSYATNIDDPTVEPRWGKVGKQKIEDAGTLYPKRMETVDDEIRDLALKFIDKAKADNKPFFVWLNPTRMHIVTHLSEKYQKMRNSKNGWSIHEAGMAQLDDDVGIVMKKLKDIGVDDNTIVVFTTDNGTEVFTWPDGGQTPFAQSKGTVMEGGFRVPAMIRWPGKVPAGKVENGLISGMDWFPTFLAAAGNPNIIEELKKGKQIGDRTYKCHLDGYNQMDMITGKGPSNRHEIWYFGESTLGAVRIDDYKFRFIDQPGGWLGDKTKADVPYITNLRLDPFERTGWPNNGTKDGAQAYFEWFKYEFWRFVFVQQEVEKLARTAIEFPPMQKGASFNLDAVKAQIAAAQTAIGKSRRHGLRTRNRGVRSRSDKRLEFLSRRRRIDKLLLLRPRRDRCGTPPQIVDACVAYAFALDIGAQWRLQWLAIKCAEPHGKIGFLLVPGCFELRTEFGFRRRLRSADCDDPAPACRRTLVFGRKTGAQFFRRLFEGEPPVIQHVLALRPAHAAGSPIECRVFVRVQPNHIDDRQCDAGCENNGKCQACDVAVAARLTDEPCPGQPTEHCERRHHEHEMTQAVIECRARDHCDDNRHDGGERHGEQPRPAIDRNARARRCNEGADNARCSQRQHDFRQLEHEQMRQIARRHVRH